jgi:predicted nucleic acid-binding protein
VSGFLLDTNCISEAVRITPDSRVVDWIDSVDEQSLYLSVITIGEIRKGVDSLALGRWRGELETWLQDKLPRRFGERILPVDHMIADRWGRVAASMRRAGTPLPVLDALLAATALHHGLTVATRNARDFRNTGVAVFNPWEEHS